MDVLFKQIFPSLEKSLEKTAEKYIKSFRISISPSSNTKTTTSSIKLGEQKWKKHFLFELSDEKTSGD